MASFTVRIELHKGGSHDYEKVEKILLSRGYRRWIKGRFGKRYCLPDFEYLIESDKDCSEILAQVLKIVESVKPGSYVVVTEAANRAWRLVSI